MFILSFNHSPTIIDDKGANLGSFNITLVSLVLIYKKVQTYISVKSISINDFLKRFFVIMSINLFSLVMYKQIFAQITEVKNVVTLLHHTNTYE